MEASAKRTARVLLDFYAGYQGADTDELRARSFETSLTQMNEVGAFTVETVAEDEIAIGVLPILLGSSITTLWLVDRLQRATGKSEEEILFDLREHIDSLDED